MHKYHNIHIHREQHTELLHLESTSITHCLNDISLLLLLQDTSSTVIVLKRYDYWQTVGYHQCVNLVSFMTSVMLIIPTTSISVAVWRHRPLCA